MKSVKRLIKTICCLGVILFMASCMNQDDYAIVRQNLLVQLQKDAFSSYWLDSRGTKLLSDYNTANLKGKMYMLYCEYDQFKVNPNLKELPITILKEPECVDGSKIDTSYIESNAPMYTLKYMGNGGFLFNRYTLAFPMYFWSIITPSKTDYDKEMAKHAFSFSYNPADFSAENGSLTLTLSHVVTDEPGTNVKRTEPTTNLLAYDLTSVVLEYESATGKKLEKIAVRSQVNDKSNSMAVDAGQVWRTDTIAYEFSK